ncbi:RNA polymerase sigma-70 factor (ECF subfamily) [Nocardioides zeae]|uniref:RNA polymerase sigma-70 factor (ECF subfamily) n=1 Tax=Nocardioides zeae TaxID=1457234 RepID=A0ACC6IF92_9ACTN|nr:RNA polymerase sigma factor [Nocardioides zeae]MDR6174910.1 RNA polymerase sigma-70 factor (ECF subfamily) [Nocardioides zeae]MDR6209280.1 RNA polymerase sigma-70 factor (ECF subfamily) [Nocardioides zeae]
MSTHGPQRSGASDDALLRAARLGDEEAFGLLADRHGPGMYRYALRLVSGSDADAKEVTQEALISAWKGIGTFAGRSSLRTWLFRLVHRRAADLNRHRRPTPIDDDLLSAMARPSEDNPLRHVERVELLRALQAALDELPWHQRAAWLLREIEGMSYDEIAAALDTTVGAVRGHLHRGRRTLAERMERWR